MISNTTSKITYDGNASATLFTFPFYVSAASLLSVVYTDADGVEATLATNLYSVTGIGTLTGGSVTYPLSGSAIATGTKLTIVRTLPFTQDTQFTSLGGYSPVTTEIRFDKVYMTLQQMQDQLYRTPSKPVSDETIPANLPDFAARSNGGAGSFFGWDASGNPYAGALAGLSGVSTFIANNLLPAANAAAARTAIGAAPLDAQGANIASAGTIDLGAATGNYVKITGTTTITALGTAAAGTKRVVEFTGSLAIGHNATTLILPHGVNITTAAGDCATFVSEGSGNWRMTQYQPSGTVAASVGATTFLGGDVALSNTGTFFAGPTTGSVGQTGWTIEVTGIFTVRDTAGGANITCQIHDGTSAIIGSGAGTAGANVAVVMTYTIIIPSMTGPTTFTLQARDTTATTGVLLTTGSTPGSPANKATSITWKRLA